jgi:hypothetical protein
MGQQQVNQDASIMVAVTDGNHEKAKEFWPCKTPQVLARPLSLLFITVVFGCSPSPAGLLTTLPATSTASTHAGALAQAAAAAAAPGAICTAAAAAAAVKLVMGGEARA